MSVDKLVSEIEKKQYDFKRIEECCQELLSDYLGAVEAYVPLMIDYQDQSDHLNQICEIVKEIMNNIQGINAILMHVAHKTDSEEMGILIGRILKGEQNISHCIEKFESS